MIIGVPRERKIGECRVGITPDGVEDLCSEGHQVVLECGAGELSGFTDIEYTDAGADIAAKLEDVWGKAELLVKVKEPAPEELPLFRPGLIVFSFLHPAAQLDVTKAMLKDKVIGLDYDLVMLDDGRLPILEPMSIIAGKLSIQCGAYALQSGRGGRGVLLGGTVGVAPGNVLVVGAGAAGSSAAYVARGMGARVTVMDIDPQKLAPFANGGALARTIYSTPRAIRREIRDADLIVGAVLIPGALAPKLVTRKMLGTMKKGAVIVDICIDQGGFAESSRTTNLKDPTYVESGVVHYCVPNMPALVPRTSTEALTSATISWINLIAGRGVKKALKESRPIRESLITYEGHLTNAIIGDALGLPALAEDKVDKLIR